LTVASSPTTLADLFGDGSADETGADRSAPSDALSPDEDQDGVDRPDEDLRDVALATESHTINPEVTSAPSDDDQSEFDRLVSEAVESGASPEEADANPAGEGPNVPPLPPTEPFSIDEVEEPRDSEMHQP